MKNTTLTATLALSIVAGATMASGSDKHYNHRMHQISFEQLDVNKDGRLTRKEMAQNARARFEKADVNGDGQISETELRARVEANMAKRVDKKVSSLMKHKDTNNDGQLSQSEMKPKHMGRMLKHADKNGDGEISKAEFARMQKEHATHRKNKHKKEDHKKKTKDKS